MTENEVIVVPYTISACADYPKPRRACKLGIEKKIYHDAIDLIYCALKDKEMSSQNLIIRIFYSYDLITDSRIDLELGMVIAPKDSKTFNYQSEKDFQWIERDLDDKLLSRILIPMLDKILGAI